MKTRYIYLILMLAIALTRLYSQSIDQNRIQVTTYLTENKSQYLNEIQYFDGLGRPMQTIQKGITPGGADLVTYQEYDLIGRESSSWLPSVVSGNDGRYIPLSSLKTKSYETYADDAAYTKPEYESSPLSRVMEQYGAGKDWHLNKKSVKTTYYTNSTADTLNCIIYTAEDTANLVDTVITVKRVGTYAIGELFVTRIEDEDGNTSFEFKDKLGQIVLTRQLHKNDASAKELYDTYYIYDNFGNLKVVLPPMASNQMKTATSWVNTSSSILRDYAYLYKYDKRNRCVKKRLPGAHWVYYVYDKADRLIFSQDGEQRSRSEWLFAIPDEFGRIVLTGICKNAISNTNYENTLISADFGTGSGIYKGYSIPNFTPSSYYLLTVNYYDQYTFLGKNGFPIYTYDNSKESGGIYGKWYSGTLEKYKGLLTGTLIAQLNGTTTPSYLASVMYYDYRGRLIQTRSNNHLNGIEYEYFAYNFTGQVVEKTHEHTASGKPSIKEVYSYTYDIKGRLTNNYHTLYENNVSKGYTQGSNNYDELGRIKNKSNRGSSAGYTYNVRSWISTIQSKYFNQWLYYNEAYNGNKKQYNGNISATKWNANDMDRNFVFGYDNLSRLKSTQYSFHNNVYDYSSVTYDMNGNIKTMNTKGKDYSYYPQDVDMLTYEYNGNQLKKITDRTPSYYEPVSPTSRDFKDYADRDKYNTHFDSEYRFNRNGAMTKDLNKGINDIQYNSLNLPMQMEINAPGAEALTKYIYSAAGGKLRVEYYYNEARKNNPLTTSDYAVVIGKPVTPGQPLKKTMDYAGNKVYENGVLSKVLVDNGYYDPKTKMYYHFVTDHLGNNRAIIDQTGWVAEKNHYAPFGMSFNSESVYENNQPYKYNGKEIDDMHGLNQYDYSARYYDPAIGRFTSVDPHAENYYSISPYTYAMNNPLKYIDPLGTDTVPANEVWEYDLIDYRTDGSRGYFDKDDYEVVINEDGEVFHLHLYTSGENEGNYMAIQQYGKNPDGYNIYEYKYVIGKDKVDEFKGGETESSGYLRGAIRAAKDGGFDGRKSNFENALDYAKGQLHPLNILFSIGTRNPWNLNDYRSTIKFGGKSIGRGAGNSVVNSMKQGSVSTPVQNLRSTPVRGTKNNPLKTKEIINRLKNR